MYLKTIPLSLVVGSSAVFALGPLPLHERAQLRNRLSGQVPPGRNSQPYLRKRASSENPLFLTDKTEEYRVNGTGLPDVDFDIGESYAGLMPISTNSSDENALFFWFFPSDNPDATSEITVWLNGGPGCSSITGLLMENGPLLWQPGMVEPYLNPFSFTNLTNVVWIDQPVGVGLSSAAPGASAAVIDETDVARDFAGFWKNFVDTFDMQGYDVYFTGESYAGMYIPYIASHFLDQEDDEYFHVKGIQINDPSIATDDVLTTAPLVEFVNKWNVLFNLNDTYLADLNARAEQCGFAAFLEAALTFPPAGPIPQPSAFRTPDGLLLPEAACNRTLWNVVHYALTVVNPCFNVYHVTDACPLPWSQAPTVPAPGQANYLGRGDVQAALHRPGGGVAFATCNLTTGLVAGRESPPSAYAALPSVVERTGNVVVASGLLDMLVLANGTLAALNNMTWHGARGFASSPLAGAGAGGRFFVPYNPTILGAFLAASGLADLYGGYPIHVAAGGGEFGTAHTERGLTYVTVEQAGHMIPQYVPGASYRQLEFLLGRIDNLTETGGFTTQPEFDPWVGIF